MMSIGAMHSVPPGPPPRDQVASELEEKVQAGEITSDDQEAMLEALDSLHEKTMETGRPDFSSGPPSKEEMQTNLVSMLNEQVEAGTLDQEQAEKLADMFENGELGGPGAGEGATPASRGDEGGTGDGMMEELMNSLLAGLQGQSSYGETGDRSTSGVASLLADFKI